MNNAVHHREKKESICQIYAGGCSRNTEVPAVVCDLTMKMWLNLWTHEIMANLKSIVDSIVLRLKPKEICESVVQDQENVKPFLASVLL